VTFSTPTPVLETDYHRVQVGRENGQHETPSLVITEEDSSDGVVVGYGSTLKGTVSSFFSSGSAVNVDRFRDAISVGLT